MTGRPTVLVVIAGTGTEVGKTWVGAATARAAAARGLRVAARKPVQSYDPGVPEPTDADELAAATGESPQRVCPPHRWYPVAVAPPMAAAELGRPVPTEAELVDEIDWPDGLDLGLVEGAGGLRSPISLDGDTATLAGRLEPDRVVLVADAGLGTLHAVRSSLDSLGLSGSAAVTVVLNRWDDRDALHRWNRDWLADRGIDVVTSVAQLLDRLVPGRR